MYKCIKIYGKQRTGTNYLTQLIIANFNIIVFQNILGWKHGLWQDPISWVHNHRYMDNEIYFYNGSGMKMEIVPYNFNVLLNIVCNGVLYLCIIKNPYAFISSYIKYYHKSWIDIDCIKEQCEDYNLKYSNYLQTQKKIQKDFMVIRYEDLLSNYILVLEKIKQDYLIPMRNKEFINIDATIGSNGQQKKKFDKKDFYMQKNFMKDIPSKIQKLIKDNINWETIRYFGYDPDK